jgi:hypothetical protein
VIRVNPTEARVALSFLAEPGDLALGALLRSCGPGEIVAAVSAGSDPRAALPAAGRGVPGLARAFERWRARLGQIPPPARRAAWERDGMRLLCPGEPEWPTRLVRRTRGRPVAKSLELLDRASYSAEAAGRYCWSWRAQGGYGRSQRRNIPGRPGGRVVNPNCR